MQLYHGENIPVPSMLQDIIKNPEYSDSVAILVLTVSEAKPRSVLKADVNRLLFHLVLQLQWRVLPHVLLKFFCRFVSQKEFEFG